MKLVVTASSLKVRSAPDESASVIATLPKGTIVESAPIDPWRLVALPGGRRGWVYGSHVSEAKPAPYAATHATQPTQAMRFSCPFCHHPFSADSRDAVLACPNPKPLPPDTEAQRRVGGRLCRASFRYVQPHTA